MSTGELIAPTIGPTRTEADFASHIEQTVATDPKASWIFVVDNLNIHCSETLVRKVAQACGIEQPLGKKGVRGVLKSVASRQAFLSERSHRIRFVYTPKHSSWLNQIETICRRSPDGCARLGKERGLGEPVWAGYAGSDRSEALI